MRIKSFLCALLIFAFPLPAFSTVDSLSVDRPDNNAVAMDAEQNFRVAYNNGGFELLRKQIDECYYKNLKRIMNDHESPGTPEERIRKSLALKACYLEDNGLEVTPLYCGHAEKESDDISLTQYIRRTSYLVLLFPYNWEGEGGVYLSGVVVPRVARNNCPYYIDHEPQVP
ncbi:hypothetical protein PT277_05245 [Acetobacteraceae bacterium ESL0709]|nr:hypothetical protein [Acetobacteraceae bacterium ESL0697]MDF7678101.1 hypothetical protein [Acetobacteraceae bacterium ESL0709]